MKKWIYLIFLILVCLPAEIFGEERNFPAGSLIIPMDSFYQESMDGGILEAYGLAVYLLDHISDGKNDITVYWIINGKKVNDMDFTIEDKSMVEGAVAALYDHAGSDKALTFKPGDSFQKISYSGGPFIIDGADAGTAKTIIDQMNWDAVAVHVAQVPFAAPVYREMKGASPKIALMDSGEQGSGNARILEAYLRLAGICADHYDVVTPNQVRDDILTDKGYDFLWVPHWNGYDSYSKDTDQNGLPDVEDIVIKVKEFIKSGRGLVAECASIEVFEHSRNGRFLTTKGLGHNGGTCNGPGEIFHNDVAGAVSQAGDFIYIPEEGHLRNWRPFVFDDPYTNVGVPPDEIPAGNPEVTQEISSAYVDTVTRFTRDKTGWDYYVGGNAYGDTANGYVVYLGGHAYAECKGSGKLVSRPEAHPFEFEFSETLTNENFRLQVDYDDTLHTDVTFNADNFSTIIGSTPGNRLEIDLRASTQDNKKWKNIIFRNIGPTTIRVNAIKISWTGGKDNQKLKTIIDYSTDIQHYDGKAGGASPADIEISGSDLTLTFAEAILINCEKNDDCRWKNIAGIRYVLNTLFDLKFQIPSQEYAWAAPIVLHPYIYQGSFEYPGYLGHFRRYRVEAETMSVNSADWDTADHIADASQGNFNDRQVFTSQRTILGDWEKIDFDVDNIASLVAPLDITPNDGDNDDEIKVVNRLRGKDGEGERSNKLGGIMHSAPVIVTQNSRTGKTRTQTAYVGDLYGMLHAIDISTGTEKWAFIPNNLLGKLQNDRTDPNAVQNFAAVDGSPAAMDIYYDHDNTPETPKEWRTILVCSEGVGGNYLFALDITDPEHFSMLWEITDPPIPKPNGYEEAPGGMGPSFRVSIGKVKSPIYEEGEVTGYELKWMVYTATGFLDYTPFGGINLFAFDLETGKRVWYFSQQYSDAINDTPGGITLVDTTKDGFIDRIFVGDMDGRLWEVNALDGTNPHGTDADGKQIPLWNAGIGNPISVSPAVARANDIILTFGTGGTDWAANDKNYHIYTVNASALKGDANKNYKDGAATLMWKQMLDVGEKVWSAPTIAAGAVLVATAKGAMENHDSRDGTDGTGSLKAIKLDADNGNPDILWTITDIGKARGSLYVDRQHVYLTSTDNKIKQIGDGRFSPGNVNMTLIKAWKQR